MGLHSIFFSLSLEGKTLVPCYVIKEDFSLLCKTYFREKEKIQMVKERIASIPSIFFYKNL